MPRGPVRRGQLIAPFGVGAMLVTRDGTGLITAGLDHWYKRESDVPNEETQTEEFKFQEWRLQELLKVDHFRLPPDYRRRRRGQDIPNTDLTIPFLRFPRWQYCPFCSLMYESALAERSRTKCPQCLGKKKTRYMVQVPFVAMCQDGHIQDFPWREWVHEAANPTCNERLRLRSTGKATLAGQMVSCECGKKRSLSGIMGVVHPETQMTHLSIKLDKSGDPYLCRGKRPWLGDDEREPCDCHIRGALRSASNVYYASVKTSIFIPRGDNPDQRELVGILESPPVSALVNIFKGIGQQPTVSQLRENYPKPLKDFSCEQLKQALDTVFAGPAKPEQSHPKAADSLDSEETAFRRLEYATLRSSRSDLSLRIREANLEGFDQRIRPYFSRIMLVDKLQETRALVGFSRIFPDAGSNREALMSRLWKKRPHKGNTWLPAYKVFGEGIFIEFNETRLQSWLEDQPVLLAGRSRPLADRYDKLRVLRRLPPLDLSPRFILLHTFAHLVMNRLTFECGYSSASLRERLYVSSSADAPMAGVLIYTAAGDAEGTLGGLVRMGSPGRLEPMVIRALEGARWCSADPVCMEIGASGGQGPNSCNLAACHNCVLVPETACEEFNRFLDRAFVVGTHNDARIGYFNL